MRPKTIVLRQISIYLQRHIIVIKYSSLDQARFYDGPNIKGRTLCYVKKNECPNVGPKRVIKFYLFNTLYTIKNNSIIIVVLLLQNFTLVVIFVHHASL